MVSRATQDTIKRAELSLLLVLFFNYNIRNDRDNQTYCVDCVCFGHWTSLCEHVQLSTGCCSGGGWVKPICQCLSQSRAGQSCCCPLVSHWSVTGQSLVSLYVCHLDWALHYTLHNAQHIIIMDILSAYHILGTCWALDIMDVACHAISSHWTRNEEKKHNHLLCLPFNA